MVRKSRILFVDDDPDNLLAFRPPLEEAGHQTIPATNGAEGWALLEQHDPDYFDVILLDRMMPVMDGIETLLKIRQHPDFKMIPVIMQTAAGERRQILEGLKAGCYYYLVKPYFPDVLLSIIETAIIDYDNYRAIKKETLKQAAGLSLMEEGRFTFKTIDEARPLATILSSVCKSVRDRVALGLTELFINAVEHGNLEIGFNDKTRLLENYELESDIKRRQLLPGYADRNVSVEFSRQPDHISFVITDEGSGFEWQDYIDFRPERMTGAHGRGIILASTMCFNSVTFNETGNQVTAIVTL